MSNLTRPDGWPGDTGCPHESVECGECGWGGRPEDLQLPDGVRARIERLIHPDSGMSHRPYGSRLRLFTESAIRNALDGDS